MPWPATYILHVRTSADVKVNSLNAACGYMSPD